MMRVTLALAPFALLAACQPVEDTSGRPETALEFPRPHRPVSAQSKAVVSSEDARDSRGEAQKVMDLAELHEGMTVADIGAGAGYYTVRLAERVGRSEEHTSELQSLMRISYAVLCLKKK